ncbi:MAG: hypothetical protein JJT75_02335 [Opitutales bacterium]|nr:hypothetical protein [Opitutales bacterium]
MKALLICPEPQSAVHSLSDEWPLAALPLLGSSVIESWLVHLAGLGFKQIVIHAGDRVEAIRSIVGSGSRWGLEIEMVSVSPGHIDAEVSDALSGALAKQMNTMDCLEVLDHLPTQTNANMFASYANWFRAVQVRLPHALTPDRVGMKEIRPGVFAGHQSRISPAAVLTAPCWVGNQAVVDSSAVIGPHAVVEDRAMIKKGARIIRSIIGPDTFVGRHTQIKDSLVSGERLINWSNGSSIRVTDVFLISSLRASLPERSLRSPKAVLELSPKPFADNLQEPTYTPVPEGKSLTI